MSASFLKSSRYKIFSAFFRYCEKMDVNKEEIVKVVCWQGKQLLGFCLRLQSKKFILLRGEKGYVACGYLDLSSADKFGDVAIKVSGVSSIEDLMRAQIASVSAAGHKLGIKPGQKVAEIIEVMA